MQTVLCDYCSGQACLVKASYLYPGRPDLRKKSFWYCRKCDAWVGCYPGTETPMGRLADAALRIRKSRAHAAFDPIWKDFKLDRSDCYKWLSRKMGVPPEKCHIGMFDLDQCLQVIKHSTKLTKKMHELRTS